MTHEKGYLTNNVGYMILQHYACKRNILVGFVDAESKLKYSALNGRTMVGNDDDICYVDVDFCKMASQVMCYESITIEPLPEDIDGKASSVSFAPCVNIAVDVKRMAGRSVDVELQPSGVVMLTAVKK